MAWQLGMEVVLLTRSLLIVVAVAAFPAPGRRVELGCLASEGRCHGCPPCNYGGSWSLGNGYGPTHPAIHRRPTVVKTMEGEPPQPSTDASSLAGEEELEPR
jgi:hypothetical protein